MSIYELSNYILSGEKIQELTDVYIGTRADFEWNPRITPQSSKFKYLETFNAPWDNPKLLFCYSQRIQTLSSSLKLFKNPCVIVFGNSDENMTLDKCKPFIESSLIKHIFCQNLMFNHVKVSFIPIGIANQQWNHGKLSNFEQYCFYNMHNEKTELILLSMSLHSNRQRAQWSYELSIKGIQNRKFVYHKDYLDTLAMSKFCICPEGNGIDTHRLWEALYMKSIPILRKCAFTDILVAASIPCVLVDSWTDINISTLPDYDSFDFGEDYVYRISFLNFKNKILNDAFFLTL
jgi:hypothetical protein